MLDIYGLRLEDRKRAYVVWLPGDPANKFEAQSEEATQFFHLTFLFGLGVASLFSRM